MKIIDLYNKTSSPIISIEVLPPRNGMDEQQVMDIVKEAKPYNFGFASVTMGSDKSLRGGGLALAYRIKSTLNTEVLAHCTCVSRSREDIENMLTECTYLDLQNILALRGDPPRGEDNFTKHNDGHIYASEMVRQITSLNKGRYLTRPTDKIHKIKDGDSRYRNGKSTDFCIGVAGHPDGHPECLDFNKNFDHLKMKQDAGAEFVITQAFYDIEIFKRFLDAAHKHGITIPVIPGVMPIINPRNLRMAQEIFRVTIPDKILTSFEKNLNNLEDFQKTGVDTAVNMFSELKALQVKGIQLYTLNRKGLTEKIFSRIA